MSLIKTLTKVAIGIAVAKGVQAITQSRSTTTVRQTTSPRKAGTGRAYTGQDDLGGIMDEILGPGRGTAKASRTTTSQPRGLDDLFRETRQTTRTRQAAPSGGIEDLVSGRAGSGGLGDLLGAVLGGSVAAGRATGAEPAPRHIDAEAREQAEAAVLLRCMIQAVKADGALDAAEKAKLMEAVGDATAAEIAFVNRELAGPVDLQGLLNDIPRGLEEKAYTVSLLAIDLDQRAEAEYLHELATALGLEPAEVNAIHDRLDAPRIYD